MRPQHQHATFRPSWFIYPHAGIALIVLSESELAEQEVVMGTGEYIREATEGEMAYQESGIPKMVAEYHSIIASAPIETQNSGVAS